MIRNRTKKAFNLTETTITLLVFGIVCVVFANLSIDQFKLREKTKDVASEYDYKNRIKGTIAERDIKFSDMDINTNNVHKNAKKGLVIVIGNNPDAQCNWRGYASSGGRDTISNTNPAGCIYMVDTSENGNLLFFHDENTGNITGSKPLKLRFTLQNKSREH